MTNLEVLLSKIEQACALERLDPIVIDRVLHSMASEIVDTIQTESVARGAALTEDEASVIVRQYTGGASIKNRIDIATINVDLDKNRSMRKANIAFGWKNFWFSILTNIVGAFIYALILLAAYPIAKAEFEEIAKDMLQKERLEMTGKAPSAPNSKPDRLDARPKTDLAPSFNAM